MVYTNAKHKCYLLREDILAAIGEIIIVQYGVQIVEVDKGQKMFMQKWMCMEDLIASIPIFCMTILVIAELAFSIVVENQTTIT